jgi:L,D-transpeptidase YcbB
VDLHPPFFDERMMFALRGRVSGIGAYCLAGFIGVTIPSGFVRADPFQPDVIEKFLKTAPSAGDPTSSINPNQPSPNVRAAEPSTKKLPPEERYLSKDPQPTFTAETATFTDEAAQAYLAIVEAGGWPAVPATKLARGVSGAAVTTLKKRLSISDDLDVSAEGDLYDATVETAVRHFQERHGLEQTGSVDAQTLRALNVPAIIRYNQLLASAKRLHEIRFSFEFRYVVVNIPSADVEAIEDGKVVRRYIAVVGKPDHPSPPVEAKIGSINLNPTWTVPASIVKNEIIPHMKADPLYLAKEHIRILDQAGAEVDTTAIDWATNAAASFTLRQDSGEKNSLGTLRIDMPNKEAVYMHDTPSKSLFASSARFQSHGCVRVSQINDLAAWLLKDNSPQDQQTWNAETIDATIALGTRLDIKLTRSVPVAWVYLTGYATPDHTVHFRKDVYDRDTGATPGAPAAAAHSQTLTTPSVKPVATTVPQMPPAKTLVE